MAKCGKGCMPECEYFTTGGCISPFSCPYKIETGYINSATSTTDSLTGILMEFDEMGLLRQRRAPDPEKYAIERREKVWAEVEQTAKERDEYKHRAEVAERALRRKCEIEADSTCPCDENSEKCKECAEKRLCSTKYATQCYYEKAIQQAEREIEEEKGE